MKAAGVLKIALRVLLVFVVLATAAYLALLVFAMYEPWLAGGTREKHIREHSRFASQLKAGDTNAPLLAMDWFSDHGVYFCRVSQSGNVRSARDVGHAIQGGSGISSRFSLDSTNRLLLEAAINALPALLSKSLPKERQILVSCIRSNQWFERVYDRANVPPGVERLYELTEAYLGWFVPVVTGSHIAHSEFGNYHTSQAGIHSFFVARNVPIAVSAGVNGVQIWDVKRGSVQDVLSLMILPIHQQEGNIAAISPDGNIIAVASHYAVYAMDLKNRKLLWTSGPLEHEGRYNKHLVIGGDKGQFLFAAGAHTLERWNLLTGRKLAVLATNQPTIKLLTTSRDGRVVLAGFNDNRDLGASAASFAIWEADKDEPARRFVESAISGSGISTDGKLIALSTFGHRNLVLYDWRAEQREEVPLRVPYASGSAYSIFWSPDGKQLAAYVDTYPASIVVYETRTWKPLAQWRCGEIMADSKFAFDGDGTLLHLRDHDLSRLDVTKLKSVGE